MVPNILIVGLVLAWPLILALCWLGWQLLRQNGRLLLRLEEFEQRLKEIEFGEGEQSTSLQVGCEAPEFDLPDLAGEDSSLVKYRGQRVLLVFFNPACGFCRDLLVKLAATSPSPPLEERRPLGSKPHILIISTGGAEANRALFGEHKFNCPVLLQNGMEVAGAYKANGTPSGYLIDADGKIASELAIGSDALMELLSDRVKIEKRESEIAENGDPQPRSLSHRNGAGGATTGEGERANRFANHTLTRSKIKREGLKAGTPAPEFRLPRLDGRGELALSDLRGRPVLLVFSSPGCGPCNTVAPELEKFHREHTDLEVVMISKGEPKENRAKVKEHGLTFPVVLQQQWEISRRYAMFATPIAYLIDESGFIAHDVVVGLDAIQSLLAKCLNGEAMSPAALSQVT
jgi:peroxiredoxin